MDAFFSWNGWPLASDFLKLVPGLVLFPLTLMLAWKKIGSKALITYSMSYGRYTASSLSDIVLTNCKDKPLIVHAIYTVVDRHILVPLKEFSPPLVVKGLESASIACDPASSYRVGDDPFEFDFNSTAEIYITTTGGRLKCKFDQTPSVLSIMQSERYELAVRSTQRFNGHVYDHRVCYALVFSYQGKQHTAFVDVGGIIGLEWPFRVNCLRSEHIANAASVKVVLEELYGQYIDGGLLVEVLNPLVPEPASSQHPV